MTGADDRDRFIALLHPHRAAAESVCRWLLDDPQDLADTIQTATLNAFRAFRSFETGTHFRPWFLRFVSYAAMNQNRARRRRAAVEVTAEPEALDLTESLAREESYAVLLLSPEELVDRLDAEVGRALRRVPETERAVFLLRALGELSYKEIAVSLSIPIGSVMAYLHRARSKLRLELTLYAERTGILRRTGRDKP